MTPPACFGAIFKGGVIDNWPAFFNGKNKMFFKLFAKNYRAGSFFSVPQADELSACSYERSPGIFSMASFLAGILLIPFQLILQSWWISPLWQEIFGGDAGWYKRFRESWVFITLLHPINLGILLPLRAFFLGLMIIPGEIINFFVSIF